MSRALPLLTALLLLPALGAAEEPPPQAPPPDDPPEEEDGDAPEGDDDDSADPAEPDDAPAEGPEARARKTVVITATGEEQTLSDAPAQVRLVDRTRVRQSQAADAAELLRRVPGVPVLSHSDDRRGGISGINLRGAGPGRTLVLLDGRPMAGDTGGVIDLSQIPADALERVEIIEGPMSARYGSAALGGVVNFITRRPAKGWSLDGRFQGRSDRSLSGAAQASHHGRTGLLVETGATWRHGEAIDLDDETPATDLDRRSAASVRGLVGKLLPDGRIEGSLLYTHEAREGVLTRVNNAIDHTSIYETPKEYDRLVARVKGERRFSPAFRLELAFEGTGYFASLSELLRDSPVRSERRTAITRWGGGAIASISALSWLRGQVGLDGSVETLEVVQDRVLPGGDTVRLEDVAATYEGRVEPWAQATLRSPDDRLLVHAGIRVGIHPEFGVAPAPSLQVRLKTWPGGTLRVAGGRGYRAPTLKDRYLVFDHAALGYLVVGDPALEPESSWSVSASVQQEIREVFTLRVGGWADRLQSLIAFVYDAAASTDGLNVYRPANIEGARSLGLSADAELRLPRFGATLAYRFLWAPTDDGGFLPDAPVHALRASLEGTLPKVELELFSAVAWESERFVDAGLGLRSPGMVRWDLRVSRAFPPEAVAGGQVSVYVGVDNLLDQRRDPDREGDFRPVEGRTFTVGIRGRIGGRYEAVDASE